MKYILIEIRQENTYPYLVFHKHYITSADTKEEIYAWMDNHLDASEIFKNNRHYEIITLY